MIIRIRNDHGKQILTESHFEHAVEFFGGSSFTEKKKNPTNVNCIKLLVSLEKCKRLTFQATVHQWCWIYWIPFSFAPSSLSAISLLDFSIAAYSGHFVHLGTEIENMSSEHYIKNNIYGELREVLQ